MSISNDYKSKLANYTKIDKIRRNMLIMIARSKEGEASEIVEAIEHFRKKETYRSQINDLVVCLREKSNVYRKLLREVEPETVQRKRARFSPDIQLNSNKDLNSKDLNIKDGRRKKTSLENILEHLPCPPAYALFHIGDKAIYYAKNAELLSAFNKNLRDTVFKNFNQKAQNFQEPMGKYLYSKTVNSRNSSKISYNNSINSSTNNSSNKSRLDIFSSIKETPFSRDEDYTVISRNENYSVIERHPHQTHQRPNTGGGGERKIPDSRQYENQRNSNQNMYEQIEQSTEQKKTWLEEALSKMFKPVVCNHCGKRYNTSEEDKFKYMCHIKNHETDLKNSIINEDYKNRKTRDYFPQEKAFEMQFRNSDLFLPSLDDF